MGGGLGDPQIGQSPPPQEGEGGRTEGREIFFLGYENVIFLLENAKNVYFWD